MSTQLETDSDEHEPWAGHQSEEDNFFAQYASEDNGAAQLGAVNLLPNDQGGGHGSQPIRQMIKKPGLMNKLRRASPFKRHVRQGSEVQTKHQNPMGPSIFDGQY